MTKNDPSPARRREALEAHARGARQALEAHARRSRRTLVQAAGTGAHSSSIRVWAARRLSSASSLRPRHLVALTVLRDQGSCTQALLASTLQMDRTNLVGLLNELESDGLIDRRRSPEDRRRHIVGLTTAGEQRLQAAEAELAAAEDEVLAALDARQRETLYELLALATNGRFVDCAAALAESSNE